LFRDKQQVFAQLGAVIQDYLKAQGLELVDLIYRYEGRDLFLRVLADRPEGGITMDECSRVNDDLGKILDEKDLITEHYILEVSSPGLDRPLVTQADFARCLKRKIRVFLREAVEGKIEWEGLISRVEQDKLYLEAQTGIIEIPIEKINKAKQIIG
jgi:ribosome maturation factor RimP